MTAAWFQSITSENGNSHPLLSITGTQAACTHTEALQPLTGTRPLGQALRFAPLLSFSAQALSQLSWRWSEGEATWQRTPEARVHRRAAQFFMFFHFALIHIHWKVGLAWRAASEIWCLHCQTRAELLKCCRCNTGEFNIKWWPHSLLCEPFSRELTPSIFIVCCKKTLQKIQIIFNSRALFPQRSEFLILFDINSPNRGNCTNTTYLSSPVYKNKNCFLS